MFNSLISKARQHFSAMATKAKQRFLGWTKAKMDQLTPNFLMPVEPVEPSMER